jgi:hypothetical protein
VDVDPAHEAALVLTLDRVAGDTVYDAALVAQTLAGLDLAVPALTAYLQEAYRSVLATLDVITDPADLWQDMPAFTQDGEMPLRQIVVSFATAEAVATFARLVGAAVTDRTKSLWFPARPRESRTHLGYVSATEADV